MGAGCAGSSTTSALWPKRSQKISPGCIVITPMRSSPMRSSPIRGSPGWPVAGVAIAGAASSQARPSSRQAAMRPALMKLALMKLDVRMHAQVQRVQPARVGARDAEAEAAQGQFLSGLREVPDRGRDQAADGVVLVVVEVGAE